MTGTRVGSQTAVRHPQSLQVHVPGSIHGHDYIGVDIDLRVSGDADVPGDPDVDVSCQCRVPPDRNLIAISAQGDGGDFVLLNALRDVGLEDGITIGGWGRYDDR